MSISKKTMTPEEVRNRIYKMREERLEQQKLNSNNTSNGRQASRFRDMTKDEIKETWNIGDMLNI